MQLPFEGLVPLRKDVHLPRDQLVEVGPLDPVEVAIENETAARQTEHPQKRPVLSTLGTLR